MKYNGFNLALEEAQRSPDDWKFGAMSRPCITDIQEMLRQNYLPVGEVQMGREDTMDCASRGPINILEAKFNWLYREKKLKPENLKWLEDKGYVKNGYVTFSDAFIAIKSGTTKYGNSMKAPIDTIHNFGMIPKSMLPLGPYMTWDEYSDPKRVTKAMVALGQEFLERFPIFYEFVSSIHFDKLYEEDFLVLAGYAWTTPVKGEYPANGAGQANHVFVGFRSPLHFVYDNYIDSVDGDFIKKLAPDYPLMNYGYRIFINAEYTSEDLKKKDHWLIALIKKVLGVSKPQVKVPDTRPKPTVKSPREKLYDAAVSCLGIDASPKDAAPDEFGCAETVNEIHFKAFGEYIEEPGISTTKLFAAMMDRQDKFVRVTDPEPGNIIISPTGFSQINTLPIKNGHVGIMGKDQKIMSNSSATGKFEENYTLTTWAERYRKQGGYPIFFFKRI